MEVLAAEELNAVESNGVPSVLRTRHWTRTVSIRGWTMRQMDRSAASRTSLRTVSHFLSRHTPDYAVHIVWKAQLSDKRASKRVHQSPSHTLPAANRAAASYSKSRVEGLVETNDAAICRQKATAWQHPTRLAELGNQQVQLEMRSACLGIYRLGHA